MWVWVFEGRLLFTLTFLTQIALQNIVVAILSTGIGAIQDMGDGLKYEALQPLVVLMMCGVVGFVLSLLMFLQKGQEHGERRHNWIEKRLRIRCRYRGDDMV